MLFIVTFLVLMPERVVVVVVVARGLLCLCCLRSAVYVLPIRSDFEIVPVELQPAVTVGADFVTVMVLSGVMMVFCGVVFFEIEPGMRTVFCDLLFSVRLPEITGSLVVVSLTMVVLLGAVTVLITVFAFLRGVLAGIILFFAVLLTILPSCLLL